VSHYHKKTGGGNTSNFADATYFAYHIRRGDFQYDEARLDPAEIWNNTKHLLDPAVTRLIYIATDEKNKTLFAPFMKDFKVRFFRDITDLAKLGSSHLNQNHVGMVEQVFVQEYGLCWGFCRHFVHVEVILYDSGHMRKCSYLYWNPVFDVHWLHHPHERFVEAHSDNRLSSY
jgi:hypothetical protein